MGGLHAAARLGAGGCAGVLSRQWHFKQARVGYRLLSLVLVSISFGLWGLCSDPAFPTLIAGIQPDAVVIRHSQQRMIILVAALNVEVAQAEIRREIG